MTEILAPESMTTGVSMPLTDPWVIISSSSKWLRGASLADGATTESTMECASGMSIFLTGHEFLGIGTGLPGLGLLGSSGCLSRG